MDSQAMNKTEEESENLHQQVLDREIDIEAFLQKYKKLQIAYYRKSLIFVFLIIRKSLTYLAAKTSNICMITHKE